MRWRSSIRVPSSPKVPRRPSRRIPRSSPHTWGRVSRVMPLEVRGGEAGYGHLKVLRGISLSVKPGEIAAVIGANGAGKTTQRGGSADAGHRAGTHGSPQAGDAGRAFPGSGAPAGSGTLSRDRRTACAGSYHSVGGTERPTGAADRRFGPRHGDGPHQAARSGGRPAGVPS